jgi:hypothetical protein
MMSTLQPRGLTLLVSIILTSVILSVSLALFDITYKQVVLASSAKQSQIAFYAADTALECVLYWDQQKDAFDYNATTYLSSGITCNNLTIVPANAPNSTTQDTSAGIRTTVLYILNASGGTTGKVTIYKKNTGATTIFANGYSTGNTTDPRRIERGLTVTYGS